MINNIIKVALYNTYVYKTCLQLTKIINKEIYMLNYEKTFNPVFGGNLWKIQDINLAITDGGYEFMSEFIKNYFHDNWSLSIFDTNTNQTIEILCETKKMPEIVSYIYHLEQATPLTFIGENFLTESYVVGMNFTRGRIELGETYKDVDGKLVASKKDGK